MTFKRYLGLGLLLTGLCLVTACGKVTQDAQKSDEIPAFQLNTSLSIIPTTNLMAASIQQGQRNQDVFTYGDDAIYFQVLGISPDLKREELSWGKALIIPGEPDPKDPKKEVLYDSKAYNKANVVIKKTDYKESYLTIDSRKNQWKVSAAKLKMLYPIYAVQAYKDAQYFGLKILDAATVSGNKSLNLDPISPYDTFLASLFFMAVDRSEEPAQNSTWMRSLEALYTLPFFLALDNYRFPDNTVKKFNVTTPLFEFKRPLESLLLDVFSLANSDKKEAVRYVKQLKPNQLSEKAQSVLLKSLETYQPLGINP